MQPVELGYFTVEIEDVEPGAKYCYVLSNGAERPDPASRYQPEGVHGPSQVVDPRSFEWTDDNWRGIPHQLLVIYELHVGTYTAEGTFDALIDHLDDLVDLGITAIEVMPVAQCPGSRNWGYDGVDLFAVQNSYGGPEAFARFVDACHQRGLAVILDVVYNHIGPEGNYLDEFGPYHTEKYHTPWGPGLNYDGIQSDQVRRFFIDNALRWVNEYHVDGFRLDAIQMIYDNSAQPFLQQLAASVHQQGTRLGRHIHMTAENLMNYSRVINPQSLGGYGMDAEWSDDFHHALHAYLTGENVGYYADFGSFSDVATAYRSGFVYTGRYMSFRGAHHGDVPRLYDGENFIVFAQNHDQIGNRARGDRLSTMIPFEQQKVVAGVVLLAPYLPILFMGEEYGETAPFQFFVDHSDPDLVEAVRVGRAREFARFKWQGSIPDPFDLDTFERSKLDHELVKKSPHGELREYYRALLHLRRERLDLSRKTMYDMEVVQYQAQRALMVRRWSRPDQICMIYTFARSEQTLVLPLPEGRWRKILDSSDEHWAGSGSLSPEELESDGEAALGVQAMSCVVYELLSEAS